MRAQLLLAWRLQRWEIGAVAVAAIGLSAVAVAIAGRLDGIVAACRAATVVVAPCGGLTGAGTIYDTTSQAPMYLAMQGLAALPFAAGVVLGVPLVARELEHGTAQLSWSLARSRARWLALRLLPVAALGAAVLVIPAVAGEVMLRSLYPPVDAAANFEGYGVRGPLLVLRFLPALAVSALVGVWLGRQLPAVLVAGVVTGGMGIGLLQVEPLWVEPVEQPQRETWQPIDTVGDLFVRIRYRDSAGAWLRDEEAWELMTVADDDPTAKDRPEEVIFSIQGERYHDVVLRESLALVAGAGAAIGVLGLVVQRRRPG